MRLGLIDAVEHLFRGIAGQPGNVGQTALRIGQFTHGGSQLIGVSQFLEGIVQLAREMPDLVVDVLVVARRGRRILRVAVVHGAYNPSFLMIRVTFSSNVALVNGLTI